MQMLKKHLGITSSEFDDGIQTLKDSYGLDFDEGSSLTIPKIKFSNDILLKQMLAIKRKIIRQQRLQRQHNM